MPKRLSPFISALLIYCLAQQILPLAPAQLYNPISANYRFCRRSLKAGLAKADYLCIGDSMVKYGISSSAIRTLTGKTTFNLAGPGACAVVNYYILSEALSDTPHAKAIIIDFEPLITKNNPWETLNASSEILTCGEWLDLCRNTKNFDGCSSLFLQIAFPLYRFHREICLNLFDKPETRRKELEMVQMFEKSWYENSGQTCAEPKPEPAYPWLEIVKERVPWTCHPLNEKYIERIFKLAKSKGVEVFWLLPPLHPLAQAEVTRLGLDQSYVAFARQLQSRFDNVTILDGRFLHYDASSFIGGTHLNSNGAKALSCCIGKYFSLCDSAKSSGVKSKWVILKATDRSGAKLF